MITGTNSIFDGVNLQLSSCLDLTVAGSIVGSTDEVEPLPEGQLGMKLSCVSRLCCC